MKNKLKIFCIMLAMLICAMSFSVVSFAYSGDTPDHEVVDDEGGVASDENDKEEASDLEGGPGIGYLRSGIEYTIILRYADGKEESYVKKLYCHNDRKDDWYEDIKGYGICRNRVFGQSLSFT